MRRDLGRVAVGEAHGLQRAARLVERAPQRGARRSGGWRPRAPRRARRPARRACARASSTGSAPAASTTAHSSRAADRDERAHVGARERGVEQRLGGDRVGGREGEHRELVADAERAQARRELVGIQAAGQRLGEHVAGEPALGVARDPQAHELERDDGRGLLQDQPLEVAQRAVVADAGQPRRGAPAGHHGQRQHATVEHVDRVAAARRAACVRDAHGERPNRRPHRRGARVAQRARLAQRPSRARRRSSRRAG